MANIIINNKLKLNLHGLRVKASDGSWIDLHCQQGRLDGACAVYSLVMALLSIGYLEEKDISVYEKFDKRTAKGRFLHNLMDEQGLVRNGFYLSTLAKKVRESLSDLEVVYHRKEDLVLDEIEDGILNYNPVVISVENDMMCHAILVIGIEYDEDETLRKLLCLDPGYALPQTCYWNCVIELKDGVNEYTHRYIPIEDKSSRVRVNEMLRISKIDE